MGKAIRIIVVLVVASVMWGCGGDGSHSTFAGSWVMTNPNTGAIYLWSIEEVDDGYDSWFYTDRAEWCDDQPYRSEFSPEVIDEVTLEFTRVTNQCLGGEESSNSFAVGRLAYDPESDTLRDAGDPAGWHYERDSSVEPGDLFPTGDN
jgi:hypothetical protein